MRDIINISPFKRKYKTVAEVDKVIAQAKELKDCQAIEYANKELIQSTPAVEQALTAKREQLKQQGWENL